MGEGDPQAVRVGFTASDLQATADLVGGRHLSLLLPAYESSSLRLGPPNAPQPCRALEILKVQRTLPGMLADGRALMVLRSLSSVFLVCCLRASIGRASPGRSGPF